MLPLLKRLLVLLLLTGSMLVCLCQASAASPYVGTWTVVIIDPLLAPGKLDNRWLVEIGEKDDKGKVPFAIKQASDGDRTKSGVVDGQAKVDGSTLRLTFKVGDAEFPASLVVPKKATTDLYGSIQSGNFRRLLRLTKSTADDFAGNKGPRDEDAGAVAAFQKVRQAKGEQRLKNLNYVLENYPNESVGLAAAAAIFKIAVKEKKTQEITKRANALVTAYERYGAEAKIEAREQIVRELMESDKEVAKLAVPHAKDIHAFAVGSKDKIPAESMVRLLSLVVRVLGADEKEAKQAARELVGLEDALDVKYREGLLGMLEKADAKPKEAPKRQGKSKRKVAVELFTCSGIGNSAAAEAAISELVRTCEKANLAVFVQYPLEVDDAEDALALKTPEAKERGKAYGVGNLESDVPALFIDGNRVPLPRGDLSKLAENYKALRESVTERMEKEAKGTLVLKVKRDGNEYQIVAEATGIELTDTLRVRFAIVEEEVRSVGGNGVRLHSNVVREVPGGAKGVSLTKKQDDEKILVTEVVKAKALAKKVSKTDQEVKKAQKAYDDAVEAQKKADKAKTKADEALEAAKKAEKDAKEDDKSKELANKTKVAEEAAKKASEAADEARKKVEAAKKDDDQAEKKKADSQKAHTDAVEAQKKADDASTKADEALTKAKKAEKDEEDADKKKELAKKTKEAEDAVKKAKDAADEAKKKVETAKKGKDDADKKKVDTQKARLDAIDAQKKADEARTKADEALTRAKKAEQDDDKKKELAKKTKEAEDAAKKAKDAADEAKKKVDVAKTAKDEADKKKKEEPTVKPIRRKVIAFLQDDKTKEIFQAEEQELK